MWKEGRMRKSEGYQSTWFMLPTAHHDADMTGLAITFTNLLKHTKGGWHGRPLI